MCYMKAIGIICVVAGHSFTGSAIEKFVGLFHMPLFFFISGYLFKEKYIQNTFFFLKRKIHSLWWPTFKWIAIVVLLHNFLFTIGVYNSDCPYNGAVPYVYSFTDTGKALFSAFFLRCNELLFAGLWFIRMSILACVICFFMIKNMRTKSLIIMGAGILLIIVLALLLIEKIGSIKVPYLPFFSSFFFLIGYIWKKYSTGNYSVVVTSSKMSFLYFALLVFGIFCIKCSMLNVSLLLLLPYTTLAMMGVFLVMSICKLLIKWRNVLFCKYFAYVGNHTYDILMMHIISFKIVTLFLILIYGLDIKEIASFPTYLPYTKKGWFLFYLLMGINLPLVFRHCYNTLELKIQKLIIRTR